MLPRFGMTKWQDRKHEMLCGVDYTTSLGSRSVSHRERTNRGSAINASRMVRRAASEGRA